MTSPFAVRRLSFTLTTGGQTATTPDNLRASVTISNTGGLSQVTLEARIWGLPRSLMNSFTTLGKQTWVGRNDNTISVTAGDPLSGDHLVFNGTVSQAFACPEAPDVPFYVQAVQGLNDALTPVPPTSLKGPQDVVTILQGLAGKMGLGFNNNGVSGVTVNDPYYPRTYREQLDQCIQATKSTKTPVDYAIDNGVLYIWPEGGTKSGGVVLTVDRDHGLIGYPTYTAYGLIVTTLFAPEITRGAQLNLTCNSFPNASGTWGVIQIDHELEAQIPNGRWQTRVSLATPANSAVINAAP